MNHGEDVDISGSGGRSTASSDYEDHDNDEPDQLQHHSSLDPEAKLLRTVRNSLERSQYLRQVRCEMRRKVLEMVHGGAPLSSNGASAGGDPAGPPRAVQLINQLILEYFEWYNLQYSGEMFCVESGTPRLEPAIRRQTLLNSLGRTLADDGKLDFQPDLPVLAELVMKLAISSPPSAAPTSPSSRQ
ncbi:hypothetical protein RP20_CCG001485 [Aedes albopictus]|nr:hypothetical protein RP20_CCG001485 [Aedes albopictus]